MKCKKTIYLFNLSLEKKQAIKTSDKVNKKPVAKSKNHQKILDYLKDNGRSRCAEIEALGENRGRTYRIK